MGSPGNGSDKAKAVVIGDLNLLRAVGMAGLPAAVVSSKADYAAFNSKYCAGAIVVPSLLSSPDEVTESLLAFGRAAGEPLDLFYEDDHSLALVSRTRERLEPFYRFRMPEREIVDATVDKVGFTRMSRERDLPVPRTFLAEEMAGVQDVVDRVGLPCVLKPSMRKAWFSSSVVRSLGGTPQKVIFAQTRAELEDRFPRMLEHSRSFLVQQAIPGGDDEIFSYHAYYDAASRPLGEFVGRKVRTYPPASGISTYLRLVNDDEVVALGRDIARKLDFVGVVKMDFKRDPATKRFYLMEINPRFNLWHYLGAAAGINLPLLAHRDCAGTPVNLLGRRYRTDLYWLSFRDDFRSFLLPREAGSPALLPWLWSFRRRKICNTFAWNDIGPWRGIQIGRARRILRRLYSRPR